MKNLIFYTLLILTVLFLAKCQPPNDIGNIDFPQSVLFNLIVNENSQEIYIYRTKPNDVNEYNYLDLSEYFENNAKISIKNSQTSFSSFIIKKAVGDYRMLKGYYYTNEETLLLYPNTQYSLEIIVNDGIISGTTTTPGDFAILEPKDNSIIQRNSNKENIVITWSKSKSAYGYICEISRENTIFFPDSTYSTFKDNHKYYSSDTLLIQDAMLGSYIVSIFAFDENFYRHTFEETLSVGLQGAYGYFGSSVKKTVSFVVK